MRSSTSTSYYRGIVEDGYRQVTMVDESNDQVPTAVENLFDANLLLLKALKTNKFSALFIDR